VVSEGLRKLLEQLVSEERAKDLLLRELSHRTKNNMAIMASLLRMQGRVAPSSETKKALEAASSRISVMADLHEHMLPTGSERSVNMSDYLQELIFKMKDFLSGKQVALSVDAENIDLPESHALPIAIVVNELVTNSIKHAFPNPTHDSAIKVRLYRDSDLIVEVHDNGIGCDELKAGVGSRLVDLMVRQLDGTVEQMPAERGCRVVARIPQPAYAVQSSPGRTA
jgi:two-component system, sensor histidine kinase PdtaS